jgi:flagellar basal-body rod modification protein FlgD
MNEIDPLNTSSASQASKANAFSELTSTQFVEIMFAELANQDPLEPSDSQAMLNQLSSLRSIESDLSLSDSLDQLVSRSEFTGASALIGAVVSGTNLDGEPTIDRVFSVSQTTSGPILNLFGGSRVRFDQVIEVTTADHADDAETDDE